MKLRVILSQYLLSDLQKIAQRADLPVEPRSNKTALIDLLCRSLPDTEGLSARIQTLSEEQRHILTTLAAEGGELLEEEAIDELCDGFAHRFHIQIDALTEAGLVFRDSHTLGADRALVGIPDAMLKGISIPESDRGRLRTTMKSMSVNLLRTFARELNISIPDASRPVAIQAIRNALLLSDGLKTYLQALSENKRAILDLCLVRQRTTRHEVLGALGEHAGRDLEELLWKTPLFYISENVSGETPFFLAPDLRHALQRVAHTQGGQLKSPSSDLLQTAPAPALVQNNAPYLLQDISTLVGQIERKWPKCLKRGGISKNDQRDAARFCRGSADPGYVEFLSLFAETAGLVRPENAIWRAAPDAGMRLEQGDAMRKAMFVFWCETERWNEWASDRASGTAQTVRSAALKRLRREVVKGLQQCPEKAWVAYPSFYEFLIRLSDSFKDLVEKPDHALSGTTLDELLRRMLSSALTWMGIVNIGDPDAFLQPLHTKAPAVFQITKAGAALLCDNGDADLKDGLPPQNPAAQCIAQPNFEILAPPDLPYSIYITLCTLTDLKSQDVMTRFQITREAVQQAINRGIDIRAFFKTHSATGLPDGVDALISECENKYGEIEILSASGILLVKTAHLLDELYAQKRIAHALGKRLSPTAAAVALHTKPEALVEILHQQEYMPRILGDPHAGRGDRCQIVFSPLELAELTGFFEAASAVLSGKTDIQIEDLRHVITRLKRAMRQMPDDLRISAVQRYRTAFDQAYTSPHRGEGLEDLLRFSGPNPGTLPADIQTIIHYAIDHQLCVEIAYGPTREAPRRAIDPFSEDQTMIYAFCHARNGERVFRRDKIHFAQLTGKRFHRP